MGIPAGSRVGPYEITGTVGAGGMGVVYQAKDTRLGRLVALKTLPEEFKADEGRLKRLDLEARAVAALNHPNILAVFDLGAHEGMPYVVMELLEGTTLREALAGGALPWRKALEYGAQMALGLAAAHEKGIVHRDLKPENVFVTKDGRVKLLDFGLARSGGLAGQTSTLAQTESGAVLGTAGYMSPEQVRGQPADVRSDIFSFGAVLYELLAGRRAFEGASGVERGYAVLTAEPPEPPQPLPQGVMLLVRRCLEKAPEQRFQAARDLAFSLDSLSAISAETQRPIAPGGNRWPWVALAAAVSLLAGVLAGRPSQPTLPAPLRPAALATSKPALATNFRRLTTDGAEWPFISPDGTWFVFSRKVRGKHHLFRQRIGGENAVDLTPASTDDEMAAVISPSGEQIAWQSAQGDGGIFVMGATGESPRRVSSFGAEPSWTPDGKGLVVSSGMVLSPDGRGAYGSLALVDLATGASTVLRDAAVDRTQAVWSPDGGHLAYHSMVKGSARTVVIEGIDGGTTRIVAPGSTAWTPRWSADGALYYASTQSGPMNIWRVAVGAGGEVGESVPVTAGVAVSSHRPTLSRDGHLLLFTATRDRASIARVAFDRRAMKASGTAKVVTSGSFPAVSPDGQWIVLTDRGMSDNEDLVIARADGSDRRKLTDDRARDRVPRFTHDGRRVVFYSDRSGRFEVWSVAPDGSDLRKLSASDVELTLAVPSPTDSRIVARTLFRADMGGDLPSGARSPALVFDAALPFDQQQVVYLPPLELGGETFASMGWTSDGAEVLGFTERGGVFAWSLKTQHYRRLTSHLMLPSIVQDGRIIGRFPEGSSSDSWNLAVVELASQRLESLPFSASPNPYDNLSMPGDAAWLYFAQAESESDAWLAELP